MGSAQKSYDKVGNKKKKCENPVKNGKARYSGEKVVRKKLQNFYEIIEKAAKIPVWNLHRKNSIMMPDACPRSRF